MAAPATENARKPRMIQSAALIIGNPEQLGNPNTDPDYDPEYGLSPRRLNLQLASRQLAVCLEVLFARPPRNVLGEGRRGRLFVPANFFEVIAHILLVIRILHLAREITVGRPEA